MRTEAAPPPLALWWLSRGEWRAHPARAVASIAAIAIGVALALAVHLINASALNEFSQALASVSGEADLQARGRTAAGFSEQTYPKLARIPGVAAASPVVEMDAALGAQGKVRLVGLDVLRAAQVTPALLGEGSAGPAAFDPTAVFLSPAALAAAGAQVGGAVALTANGRSADFRIAGALPGAPDGKALAVIDIAAAQWRFGRLGALDRIDLRLSQGADARQVRRRIAQVLPPQAELSDAASEARRGDALSRAYRVNLEMLALVALVTGAFLVFSAQTLAVARRRPQFALARVLGQKRAHVLAQVTLEGLAMGLAGSLTGLALGVGLAAGGLQLLGGDLGGGYFEGAAPQLVLEPAPIIAFGLLGLG
ncbi:MAG: FtsX-like permease family protein, partial [Phenylobacterium sp.]